MTKKSKKHKSAVRAAITGVHGYVPPDVLTNAELSRMVDTTNEWIIERTGIKERHILKGKGLGTSHMGAEAVRGLLKKTGTAPSDVDLLICATTTPDLVFPSTANLICDMADIRNIGSFDVQAACSGFVYALTIAAQFVESGTYRKVIVVGADKMSAIIDYTDRATCVLFGDGAGAVLIEPNRKYGIVERAGKQQLSHGGDRLHGRPKLMADHGEQLGLRLVGRLGDLTGAPLGGEPVDQALNLREQIVRPKILRSHHHLPAPFQRRAGWQRSLKSRLNCRDRTRNNWRKIGFVGHAPDQNRKDLKQGVSALVGSCTHMARVHALSGDPPLRRRPAGFEGLSRVIVGQQLSVASANAIWEARSARAALQRGLAPCRAGGRVARRRPVGRQDGHAQASRGGDRLRRSRPRCPVGRPRNGHS